MQYTKKIVAILLLVIMAYGVFAGCANDKPSDSGNTSGAGEAVSTDPEETTSEEDVRLYPDLPDDTYDGYEFRLFVSDYADYRTWEDLWAEEDDVLPISVAVRKRDLAIMDKYDIKMSMTVREYLDYESAITQNILANDDFTDLMVSLGDDICRTYTQDIYYNLQSLDYLEFDKPWWDSNAVDSFTLGGYMPFGICDLTVNDKGVTNIIYFNKDLAEDLNIGSMYSIVKDGDWTFDKLIELGMKASHDIDGGGEMTKDDRYGLVGDDGMVAQLFNAGGGKYVSKDSEGYPVLTFDTEKNIVMIKYYLENILFDEKLTYNTSGDPDGGFSYRQMFAAGNSLFMLSPINGTEMLRSAMTDADFGIIPMPKYNDDQEKYYNPVQVYGGSVISIPKNIEDPVRTSIILEALAAESTYTVMPAFYDIVLKDKNTRDEESKEMLDLILDNRVYDVGTFYSLGGFSNNFVLITGKQYSIFRVAQTSDVVSYYQKYERQVIKAYEDLLEIIDNWNNG